MDLIKIILLVASLMLPQALGAKIKVIQHPSLNNWVLSSRDLRDIFSLYDTYWSTGEQIRVVMLPWESSEHKRFVRNVLKRSPSKFRAVVQQRLARGMSHGYISASSTQEAVRLVAFTEGAIGYGEDYLIMQLDDSMGDGNVRTVTISH